jgi:hypothetical protein
MRARPRIGLLDREQPNAKAHGQIYEAIMNTEICVMSNDDFLKHARECFRQAAQGTSPNNMRLLVELGLEYLRLAQRHAAVTERTPDDDTGSLPH